MRLKQLIQSSLACIVAVGLLAVPAIAMAGDIHTSDMLDTDTASITKLKEDGLVSGTAPFDKDDEPGDDSTPDNTIIRSFDTATYGISYTVTPDDTMSYYRKARIGFTFTLPVDKSIAGFDLDSMLWTDKTPGFEPKTNVQDGVQTLTCYRLLTPTDSSPTTVPGTSAVTFAVKVKAAKNGTVIRPSVSAWPAWDKTNPTNTGAHSAASMTFTQLTVSAKTSLDVRVAGGQPTTSEPMTWDFSKAPNAPNAALGKQQGTITAFSYAIDLRWPDKSKGLRGLQLPEGDLSFDVTVKASYADTDTHTKPHADSVAWQPYAWDTAGTDIATTQSDHVGRDTRSQYRFRSDNYQYARRNTEGNWANNATYDNGTTTITQGARSKDGSVMHVTVHNWKADPDKFPLRASATTSKQCYFGDTSCTNVLIGEITVGTIFAFSPTTVNGQTVQAIYGNKPQMQTVTGKVSNLTVASKSETDNITTDNTVNTVQPLLTSSRYQQRILYGCPTASSAYSFGSNCGVWYGKEEYTGSDALPVGHKVTLTTGFNYTSSISGLPVLQLGMVTWNPNHIDMSNATLQHSINRSQISWHDGANPTVRYGVKPDGTNWTSDTEQAKATVDALHWYDSYMEAAKHGKVVAALMGSNEIGSLQTAGNNRNASTIIGGLVGVIRKDVTPNTVTQLTGYTVVYSRQTLHDKADAPDPQASDDKWRAWANDKDAYTLLSSITHTWEIGSGNYVKASYDANGALHDPTSGDLYGDSLLITGETNTISKTVSQTDETGTTKTVYDLDKEQRAVDWKLTTKTTGSGGNTTVTVKDTLPDGLAYQAGSTCVDGKYTPSNQSSGGTTSSCMTTGDPNASKDKDGHTVLTWSIPVKSDGTGHTVMYKTSIGDATDPDKDAKNGQQYLNTATVSSTYSQAIPGASTNTQLIAQYGVRVSRTHSSNLATRADPLLMELGANVGFRDMIGNYSNTAKTDVLTVDILPYEGYHGTLTLSKLAIIPQNGASLATVSVYAIDNINVRKVDPLTITSQQVKSWRPLTMDTTTGKVTIPSGFTPIAFALITSTLPANSRYDLTLSLTPKNGQAGDTFTNLWTDGDNKVTAVSQTVSRSVSGFVWIDRDRDGSRGTGTSDVPYSDAHVTLIDKNGNTINSTTGQPLTAITGKDGAYKLENVPAGTGYRLRVTPPDWAHWTGSNLTKKAAQGVSNELSSKADPVTTAGVLQAGEITLKPFPAVSTMSSARYEDTWENVGLLSIRQSSMPMTGDNTGLVAVLLISALSAMTIGMAIVFHGRGRHRAVHSHR